MLILFFNTALIVLLSLAGVSAVDSQTQVGDCCGCVDCCAAGKCFPGCCPCDCTSAKTDKVSKTSAKVGECCGCVDCCATGTCFPGCCHCDCDAGGCCAQVKSCCQPSSACCQGRTSPHPKAARRASAASQQHVCDCGCTCCAEGTCFPGCCPCGCHLDE